MKKYKLIKSYPGSPPLTTEITKSLEFPYNWGSNNMVYPNIMDGHLVHSEYWKEIIEIPEYVKCIAANGAPSYKTGEIYKTNLKGDVLDKNGINCWGSIVISTASKFEPSTKEAYDLQELQSKFIVDKWYKNLGSNKQYISKLDYIDIKNNRCMFYAKEHIIHGFYQGNFRNYSTWVYINDNTVEATLEEIQPYLPDGHVDKIIKPILFTTYDGVDITDFNNSIWVCYRNGLRRTNNNPDTPSMFSNIKKYNNNICYCFSTKEACQAYIDNINNSKIVKIEKPKEGLITVQLTKEKYDLLMNLLEE
jgi:hypothetical protein